jgi:hypothetical protein
MRRLVGVFLALLLAACSSGPDLQIPEGVVKFELYEMVTTINPVWDPVERTVTDVRLLAGRKVSEERYEFDAEYEILSIDTREPTSESELQRIADSMRSQGREQEWKRMEAQRIAAEQYLAERVGDMKPGDKRWLRDTFILVRRGDQWMPAALGDPDARGRDPKILD